MASSDAFPTVMLSGMWEAVGMELLIFVSTLFFATVVRKTTAIPSKPRNRGKMVMDEDDFKGKPDKVTELPPVQHIHTQRPSVSLPDASIQRMARAVDEIVTAVKSQPNLQSLSWALAQYSELRDRMKRAGILMPQVAKYSRWASLDLYSALVSCAVRSGQAHRVTDIINDMVHQSVPRPIVFYESAMKQLAGMKCYQLALEVYDLMTAEGYKASSVTCSCLINFAAEAGEFDRAVEFFHMLKKVAKPSIRAYMTILRVHCRQLDWHASLAVLQDMTERGVAMDSLALNVALATCVAAEQLDAAETLLADCQKVADVISCNTIIKGYAMRGDLAAALRVVERMKACGLTPNGITMNTVMDAAVRGNLLDEAWEVLEAMRAMQIPPDKFSCTIILKGVRKLASAHHCRKALELLKEVERGCDASLRCSLHHSLLEAASSIPDRALIVEVAARMRQQGIPISDHAHRRMRELGIGKK